LNRRERSYFIIRYADQTGLSVFKVGIRVAPFSFAESMMTAPNNSRAFRRGQKAQSDMTANTHRLKQRWAEKPRNQLARRLDALFPLGPEDLPPAFEKLLREIARRLD
jgi:hypothetical protein